MPDMLVKLYELPPLEPEHARMEEMGISIRPALVGEKRLVRSFVRANFSPGWEDETDVAMARMPVACHIAVQDGKILGFACWDSVARGFFGPMGVLPETRGKGVGRALLLSCLHAMRAYGYGYAIIGWVGPAAFYEKCCGAHVINSSEPGVYRGMLREPGQRAQ
ncbi:MAG: GNAT family N-acetyltransferase [Christensenellales bacterium]|jgi:GNAT superfamily N-acetyltransferase